MKRIEHFLLFCKSCGVDRVTVLLLTTAVNPFEPANDNVPAPATDPVPVVPVRLKPPGVIEVFAADVILPCWSITITGIAVVPPYVPGVTVVFASCVAVIDLGVNQIQ
jgi:hypothetical protein